MLVTVKQMGGKRPLLDDVSVPPPKAMPRGEDLVLRQLIEHVVRSEVRSFRDRARSRRLDRVLSAAHIERAAQTGKVVPEGRPEVEDGVDPDHAVGVALQAFEDGLYLVFVDETEKRDLDEPVYVRPDSRLVFVRLTFLAGA